MPSFRSYLRFPALAAALSLGIGPVQAAQLPVQAVPTSAYVAPAWTPGDDAAADHRRYRHRRDRVDAGDVIAGVLILGGIAAIASAAKNSQPRYPDPRRSASRYGYDGARGIDRAVSLCVDAIERDARVETVDRVDRDARGWDVAGTLYDGQGFTCSIGEDGRIDAIDYDSAANGWNGSYDDRGDLVPFEGEKQTPDASQGRQYDDDYYAAARARSDASDPRPSYPGGPLPGEQSEAGADIEFGSEYQGARN